MLGKCGSWLALIAFLPISCGGAAGSSTDAASAYEAGASEDSTIATVSDCGGLEECRNECQAGKAISCEWLGHMYETGDGAPQDYQQAAEHYGQACDAGLDESCAHLAMMYDIGLAVEEDPDRAIRLYEKACDAGNRWACKRGEELE